MTHRQFVAWREYERETMNQPARGDHYLMQVACEVRRVLSRHPSDHKLDHFRLKFVDKGAPAPEHVKNMTSMAQGIWSKRVGGNIRTQQLITNPTDN